MELLKHAGFQTDSPKRRAVMVIFWILLGSLIWTKALLYSQNSLFYNSHWSPYIPSLRNLHKGNIETLFGRTLVAGHHLRTLGSQERRVFSRHQHHPKEFAFTLRLKENSAVAFLFNHHGEEFSALRLSAHPLRPSAFYQANLHEEHQQLVPLALDIPTHKAVLVNVRETPEGLQLTVDGKQTQTVPGSFHNAFIGLDVMSGAEIWAPSMIDRQDRPVALPFQRESVSAEFFFPVLGLFVLMTGLLFMLRRHWVVSAAFLCLLGAIWLAFDFFSYSHTSFAWQARELTTTDGGSFDVERMRYRLFEKAYGLLGGDTLTYKKISEAGIPSLEDNKVRYCTKQGCTSLQSLQFDKAQTQTRRVVVLGGSIGAGWGVTQYEKTYAEVLHKQLQANFNQKYDVEVLNISDSAKSYRERLEQKFELIEKFQPDIILIELLFNFIDADAFMKALAKSAPDSTKLYLMPLINPYALSESHLNSVRAGMGQNPVLTLKDLELIQAMQIRMLDPNPVMLSQQVHQGGKVFWDYYHPTDWGHSQLANYLAKELTVLIEKDGPDGGP